MNDVTLSELGFKRFPEWDFIETGDQHYRLDINNKIFRAYVCTCNPPVYIIAAEVKESGITVKSFGWKDCVSSDSLKRLINNNN